MEKNRVIYKKMGKTTQEIKDTTQETTQETTQKIIFELIKANPAIIRKGLAEKISITPSGVKYHLDKLRKQDVIRHRGYKERLLGNGGK